MVPRIFSFLNGMIGMATFWTVHLAGGVINVSAVRMLCRILCLYAYMYPLAVVMGIRPCSIWLKCLEGIADQNSIQQLMRRCQKKKLVHWIHVVPFKGYWWAPRPGTFGTSKSNTNYTSQWGASIGRQKPENQRQRIQKTGYRSRIAKPKTAETVISAILKQCRKVEQA